MIDVGSCVVDARGRRGGRDIVCGPSRCCSGRWRRNAVSPAAKSLLAAVASVRGAVWERRGDTAGCCGGFGLDSTLVEVHSENPAFQGSGSIRCCAPPQRRAAVDHAGNPRQQHRVDVLDATDSSLRRVAAGITARAAGPRRRGGCNCASTPRAARRRSRTCQGSVNIEWARSNDGVTTAIDSTATRGSRPFARPVADSTLRLARAHPLHREARAASPRRAVVFDSEQLPRVADGVDAHMRAHARIENTIVKDSGAVPFSD